LKKYFTDIAICRKWMS